MGAIWSRLDFFVVSIVFVFDLKSFKEDMETMFILNHSYTQVTTWAFAS